MDIYFSANIYLIKNMENFSSASMKLVEKSTHKILINLESDLALTVHVFNIGRIF